MLQHPIITGQQLPATDVWFLDAAQVGVCWFAQGASTIEVVQNPHADSVFASGALLLRAINDVDVFAMDGYRSVYAKNVQTIGVAGVPTPFAAAKARRSKRPRGTSRTTTTGTLPAGGKPPWGCSPVSRRPA